VIQIRPISEADVPSFHLALASVCQERRHLAMLVAPPPESVRAFVTANLARGTPQFVAVEGERVVGWCDTVPGEPNLGTAHIGRLGMGLLASHRGRGLGRRLAEATLQRARERGLQKIELEVFASNQAAIALYHKLGFVEEGRRRRGRMVDGASDDVVQMGLDLRDGNPA